MELEQAKKELTIYREKHLAMVTRDKATFEKWYDRGAQFVFDGGTKSDAVEELAPWGCSPTILNGVLAGALQATRLLNADEN